jgi:Tfp pilus assembly protein PilV
MNHRHARGTTLIEALLALVVTAFSALGALHLQAEIRRHADVTRQRTEAVRLGAAELERLRAFATVPAASTVAAYEGIVDAETTVDAASGYVSNAAYRLRTTVTGLAGGAAKALRVEVDWRGARRTAESIVLASAVAAHDPALGASLALGSGAGAVPGAQGRAHAVPVEAVDLGDGTSAWKPAAEATVALRFAHGGPAAAAAVPVALCDAVAATATRSLTPAQLTHCRPMLAATSLVRGTIRFADAVPPDPARANDAPLATEVRLVLLGGGHQGTPECWTERVTTGSDRHVAYACLVVPRADGRWSARAELLARAWTLGNGAADRRVCRLAHDRDGSGSIDSAAEHPRDWLDTQGSLVHQNFVVVRGDQACPAGSGIADPWHTEAHQP